MDDAHFRCLSPLEPRERGNRCIRARWHRMSASFQLLLQVVSTLLLLLLCWQHAWHDVSVHRPSRRRPAAGIAEPVATTPPPASLERPPRWAAASAQPVPLWEANLADERLRYVWRATDVHKPGSRHATVEIHNDSWTFLDQRQLRRGSSSSGDPLRMQCMAARLLAGEATKLSTVGGSVSFGAAFAAEPQPLPQPIPNPGPDPDPNPNQARRSRPVGASRSSTGRSTSGSTRPSPARGTSTTAAPWRRAGPRTWSTVFTGM